jgi:hypothetical protein
MYKIALIISTIPSINVFRTVLEKSFHSGHYNHFLICSGFFQERHNSKGAFYASAAFDSATLPTGSSVTVVGAYAPNSKEFNGFTQKLSTGLNSAGKPTVIVNQRRSLKQYANHWHAKIYIARQDDEHRLAVVGSSNLTRSAFNFTASNNEADVLVWDDSHPATKKIVDEAFGEQQGDPIGSPSRPVIVVSNYEPEDPRNSFKGPLNVRLKQLWNDVITATQ